MKLGSLWFHNAVAALSITAAACWAGTEDRAGREAPAATSDAAREPVRSLAEVAARLSACTPAGKEHDCQGIIYVWSERMPLSTSGISEIASATRALGLSLDVVSDASLYPGEDAPRPERELAAALVAAGASLHAPALVVHRGGRLESGAILGYKSADSYASLIGERLRSAARLPEAATAPSVASLPEAPAQEGRTPEELRPSWRDLEVPGTPGAYFRWVPGRDAVAYEAGGQVFLLDLVSGERRSAPGFVDFVPTPDGRFFVTPGRSNVLEFYDADQVFQAAAEGRARDVPPIYSDPQMRDQYPSVGILRSESSGGVDRTVYRVLTSWFDRVAFRDYEVATGPTGTEVRPVGPPVAGCREHRLSIPIMAQSGREVAGRDEASATTKVFVLADDGSCREVLDLLLPTGKVAWDADGRRLAFAIPEGAVQDGRGVLWRGSGGSDQAGVFVYDRGDGSVTRVEASLDARRLTFPEFVGDDQVLFLLPPGERGGVSRFRLVCCLP